MIYVRWVCYLPFHVGFWTMTLYLKGFDTCTLFEEKSQEIEVISLKKSSFTRDEVLCLP